MLDPKLHRPQTLISSLDKILMFGQLMVQLLQEGLVCRLEEVKEGEEVGRGGEGEGAEVKEEGGEGEGRRWGGEGVEGEGRRWGGEGGGGKRK